MMNLKIYVLAGTVIEGPSTSNNLYTDLGGLATESGESIEGRQNISDVTYTRSSSSSSSSSSNNTSLPSRRASSGSSSRGSSSGGGY